MALNTKAIKLRMKSIGNTKKITKAMEMVSAAKMRRAVEAAVRTRAYASLANELLERLSIGQWSSQPMLFERPVEKLLLLFISSNRGLCGSFNTNLFKKTIAMLQSNALTDGHDAPVALIGVGKKSALFAKKTGLPLAALFDQMGDRPSYADALPIARLAMAEFASGACDRVCVAYTDYKTSLSQEPVVRQILPVTRKGIRDILETADVKVGIDTDRYAFEPSAETILSAVLPGLVEVQVYQAILESLASEHSARMVAMKSATDAAGDMLQELRLSFNKARQAAITQEISEIVGGSAALE